MSPILFRCDASLQIGSGHVMRCRTLARELRRQGAEISFICRQQPGDFIELLRKEFQVLALPPLAAVASSSALEGRALYVAWLGCSQQQDAADCLAALEQAGINSPQWLVVDHYGLDASWEVALREGLGSEPPPQLLVIDDLADRRHSCDLLLDQNFFGAATQQRYRELVSPQCRQLLGPHYALLGPEYAQLHPLVPPRTYLRRVLVFFGGVDGQNLTGRTLEALLDPKFAHLAVDVVLGLQSPHFQSVENLVAQRPDTTLHGPQPSLAVLIARADLAIGAGGATTWERACLGLPSLVVAIAANQLPFAQCLDQAGHLQLLGVAGEISVTHLRQAFAQALEAPPVGSGHCLTDGWGTSRLASALLGLDHPIRLRLVAPGDEALLLRWANDPAVRASSFSTQPIQSEDHHSWFEAGLSNPERLQLVALDQSNCPIGQIRFDRVDGLAIIDISVDAAARGLGLAGDLISSGLAAMLQHWGSGSEALAEVLPKNRASQAVFVRAGFIPEPNPDPEAVSVVPPRRSMRFACVGGRARNSFKQCQ